MHDLINHIKLILIIGKTDKAIVRFFYPRI